MSVTLKVYINEDDALLFWSPPSPISKCRGFAIQRRITRSGQQKQVEDFLVNRMGFEAEKQTAVKQLGQEAVTQPSTVWPFQRFLGQIMTLIPATRFHIE